MGCAATKQKKDSYAEALAKAAAASNKKLARRESLDIVIDVADEMQKWEGTIRTEGAAFDDRYEQIQKIGKGSFGTVFKVRSKTDQQQVLAAKTVEKARCTTQEEWRVALKEVDNWSTISSPYHPSILQLIEAVHMENESLHLVTEVMVGGELADAFQGVVELLRWCCSELKWW